MQELPYYDLEDESEFARWLAECACDLCGQEHESEDQLCEAA